MSDLTNNSLLFSIILPAYGVEEYISDALDDILNQSYSNWETIVVDDCSPDASGEIAKRYAKKDSRIKVISHDHNRGLSAARNTGLGLAQGSYVWFPDPDDRYEKELLNQVAGSLQSHKSPVVLIGHREDYFSSSGEYERSIDFVLNGSFLDQEHLRNAVIDLERQTQYGYAWNKIYNRQYLLDGKYSFVEDLPLIEDIEFNIRVFQNLPSLNIVGAPLYHYAKREKANLTNKFVPRYYEVHRKRIQLLRDQQYSWGLLSDDVKAVLGMLFARYILSALERNCDPQSNMKHSQRVAWCKEVFQDELFKELIPFAKADSAVLNACIKALRKQSVSECLALGSVIHHAKQGVLHDVFLKLKGKR